MPRHLGTLMPRAPSAAFSVPPTAAGIGTAYFSKTKTPEPSIWPSIRATREPFTPHSGKRAGRHGMFIHLLTGRGAGYTNRLTAEPRGPNSRAMDFLPKGLAAWALPWRPRSRIEFTFWWTQRMAGSIARTTRGHIGAWPIQSSAFGGVDGISAGLPRTQKIRTWYTFAILQPIARPTAVKVLTPSRARPAAMITTAFGLTLRIPAG